MVTENIPHVVDVYDFVRDYESFTELTRNEQEEILAMLQHWQDNYEYESSVVVRCKPCLRAKLKNPSLRGQIKHQVDHLIDAVRKGQTKTLWF